MTAGENPVPLVIAGGAGADYMGRSSDQSQPSLSHCSFNDGAGFSNSKASEILLLVRHSINLTNDEIFNKLLGILAKENEYLNNIDALDSGFKINHLTIMEFSGKAYSLL